MALTGNEILYVQGVSENDRPAATEFPTTTSAIAALANSQVTDIVNTAISTAGNGTLTAAALFGGVITRTGPSGAFTDTTATAAQLYAIAGSILTSFEVKIKNTTPYLQTIAAGSGVTLPSAVIVPANSVGNYLVTINTANTATFVQTGIEPLTSAPLGVSTTLSTVGAGTITAAGIAGRITSRTGSQSGTPFTDTTDTADNIIAALPNANIGQSFEYTYSNTTNAVATITGGTGVTVSGITAVNAGYSARFIVTYTAASTVTMVGFSSGQVLASTQQSATFAGSTSGTTKLVASAVAGSTTQTLPAVTGTVASTTGSNLFVADLKRCTAQVDATTTTLANVTGLSFTVVPGTYQFVGYIDTTCGGTGGVKLAFNYTTAVLSAINANAIALTASAVAQSKTTTTTTQTSIVASNTAFTQVQLNGTMVVTTGGTVDLQFAENSANSTSSVLVGSSLQFTRIA